MQSLHTHHGLHQYCDHRGLSNLIGCIADHEGDDERIFGITTGSAGIVSRSEATWFTRYAMSVKMRGEMHLLSQLLNRL